MIINPDGTKTVSNTYKGVTTTKVIDKNGKVISESKSNAKKNNSKSNSGSSEKVVSVDYQFDDGRVTTVSKSQAEQMDKNRTDGKSGIVAGSETDTKMTKGTDYTSGGTSSGRQTMYEASDKNTGEKKVIYSNYNNYLDAFKEAGLGDNWKLDQSVSYRAPNEDTYTPYVTDEGAQGGFADLALKQLQAAEYLYGKNANQLTEEQRAILQGLIDGTVSTAGVNFGDATVYEALKNGSTSKGTYENIDLSGLKSLLESMNAGEPQQKQNFESNAYQDFINQQKANAEQLKLETMLPVGPQQTDALENIFSGNPYADIAENMQNMYGGQGDAIKELYAQMAAAITDSMEKDRTSINEQYDDAAKEAYINLQRQQFALPGQLAASGLTGGASETANINLNNNYSNNISNINTGKINANRELDKNITDVKNQYNLTAGEQIIANSQNAIDAYLALMGNAADYQYQTERDAVEDARYEEERAYNRQQDSIANAQTELSNAISLAQMGDSSKLVSLGYTSLADAIEQERSFEKQMQDLELKSAQLAYGNKISVKNEELVPEPDYFADIDAVLGGNNTQGRFDTANGLLNSAAYGVDNSWFSKDEYNKWAKSRGFATL